VVVARADNPLPAEVVSRLEFMAGEWKTQGTFHGETFTETCRRRLAPSKTALFATSESTVGKWAGVTGWDPGANEFVETCYDSTGAQFVVRYNIVTDATVWEGTVTVHAASGEREQGTCRLEKTGKDSFKFTAKTNKTEVTTLATRVKRGK
jgi:hypothetical protein